MSQKLQSVDRIPRVSYRTILKRKKKDRSNLLDPSDSIQTTKRYLKFLSVCNNPKAFASVLRTSPDSVIKRICDAALNAAQGEIPIDDRKKKLFKRNRKTFSLLLNPRVAINRKRRYLSNQKGGAFPLIPILLSTVLTTLGSLLVDRLKA